MIEFPAVPELIAHAEKVIGSCFATQQVWVTRKHILDVVKRGEMARRYSSDDVLRLGHVVDYMARKHAENLPSATA